MKKKFLFVLLIVVFLLSACSSGGWTQASKDTSKCDDGKKMDEWMAKLSIDPGEGDAAIVWQSYNGAGCGEQVGELETGKELEWSQIVENASGEMLVNVKSPDLPASGWVNCADLSFTGDMESLLGRLSDEGDDLYVACVNISKQ